MTPRTLTRRSFLTTLGSAPLVFARAGEPEYRFTQFHNQAATSTLHRHLTAMWAAIARDSGGRVSAEVFAENRGTPGSDPAALRMLQSGEIQFFTLMGGILGNVVPSMNVQQMPFMFRSAAHALRAMDGPLGAYLARELEAGGLQGFRVGAFDNGMRQIASVMRPVSSPGDLAGVRMRVPAGPIFADTFAALGATPVVLNVDEIYAGLKNGRVDAQENPLAVVELFKLYEVVRYVSLTSHMWSGFNLLAHRPTWMGLPRDVRGVIERHVTLAIRRQRVDQARLNAGLRAGLRMRGLSFNDVEPAPFRAKLEDRYRRWKADLGSRCWALLEAAVSA